MARPEGFEPPAFRIGICCDIQLRHGRMHLTNTITFCLLKQVFLSDAPFLFLFVLLRAHAGSILCENCRLFIVAYLLKYELLCVKMYVNTIPNIAASDAATWLTDCRVSPSLGYNGKCRPPCRVRGSAAAGDKYRVKNGGI